MYALNHRVVWGAKGAFGVQSHLRGFQGEGTNRPSHRLAATELDILRLPQFESAGAARPSPRTSRVEQPRMGIKVNSP